MTANSDTRRPRRRQSIFGEIVGLQRAGRRGVLAAPFRRAGSVPVGEHARLLVREDGSIAGTVGGGALEAEVLRVASQVLAEGRARLLDFDLTADQAAASGMICGGRCAILVEPVGPGRDEEVFAALSAAEATGHPIAAVIVMTEPGGVRKMAVAADGVIVGSSGDRDLDEALAAEAQQALADGHPRELESPARAHIEPILPRPPLFIFGAGHIAIPLAHMAGIVGFRVTVVDDREEFANRERFPEADEVLVVQVADAFRELAIGGDGYVVSVTRGHAMDEEVVTQALTARAHYVGMIGSKRKVASVRERLRERGFRDADVARVHAPIGVDIGADTVEEIAVSIVAELVQVRRSG